MTTSTISGATTGNGPQQLNTRQLRAVDLVASGMTDTEVAAAVSADRATIWRWRTKNPFFEAALNGRREEIWSASRDRLRALSPLALDALEEELRTGGPSRARIALEVLKLLDVAAPRSDIGWTDAGDIVDARVLASRRSVRDILDTCDSGGPPTQRERESVLREAGGS